MKVIKEKNNILVLLISLILSSCSTNSYYSGVSSAGQSITKISDAKCRQDYFESVDNFKTIKRTCVKDIVCVRAENLVDGPHLFAENYLSIPIFINLHIDGANYLHEASPNFGNIPRTLKKVDPCSSPSLLKMESDASRDDWYYKYSFTFDYGKVGAHHRDNTLYILPVTGGTPVEWGEKEGSEQAVRIEASAGDVVLAARAGKVVLVDDSNPRIGEQAGYPDDNVNKVMIEHDDGTLGTYFYIDYGSSPLRAGQYVSRGDTIGRVGLGHGTRLPYIHFQVTTLTKYSDGSVAAEFCVPHFTEGGNRTKKLSRKLSPQEYKDRNEYNSNGAARPVESYHSIFKTEREFLLPPKSKVLYRNRPLKSDSPFVTYTIMFETAVSSEDVIAFYNKLMRDKECIKDQEVVSNQYHALSLQYSCNAGYEADFSISGTDQSYSSQRNVRMISAGFSLPSN